MKILKGKQSAIFFIFYVCLTRQANAAWISELLHSFLPAWTTLAPQVQETSRHKIVILSVCSVMIYIGDNQPFIYMKRTKLVDRIILMSRLKYLDMSIYMIIFKM